MHDERRGQGCGARILVGLRDMLIADVLTRLLEGAGFRAAATCGELEVLLAAVARTRPDAAMGELGLAGPDGVSPWLAGLRAAAPETRIVVVAREVDGPLARALVRYSVNGMIPLTTQSGDAVHILRQVIDGHVVYP